MGREKSLLKDYIPHHIKQIKLNKQKRKQATVEKTSSINKDGLAIGCLE